MNHKIFPADKGGSKRTVNFEHDFIFQSPDDRDRRERDWCRSWTVLYKLSNPVKVHLITSEARPSPIMHWDDRFRFLTDNFSTKSQATLSQGTIGLKKDCIIQTQATMALTHSTLSIQYRIWFHVAPLGGLKDGRVGGGGGVCPELQLLRELDLKFNIKSTGHFQKTILHLEFSYGPLLPAGQKTF